MINPRLLNSLSSHKSLEITKPINSTRPPIESSLSSSSSSLTSSTTFITQLTATTDQIFSTTNSTQSPPDVTTQILPVLGGTFLLALVGLVLMWFVYIYIRKKKQQQQQQSLPLKQETEEIVGRAKVREAATTRMKPRVTVQEQMTHSRDRNENRLYGFF